MTCKIINCIPCKIFKTYQRDIDNDYSCPICFEQLVRGYDGYYYTCEHSESHIIEILTFELDKMVETIYIGFPKLFNFFDHNSKSQIEINKIKTIKFVLNDKLILNDNNDPKLIHWDKIDILEEQIAKLVVFT